VNGDVEAGHAPDTENKPILNDLKRPWGRRAIIQANKRFLLVDFTGHAASVLHDSAVYARKL